MLASPSMLHPQTLLIGKRAASALLMSQCRLRLQPHAESACGANISLSGYCVVCSCLDNYAYLVKKYCMADATTLPADDPHSAALQALQDSVSLSEISNKHPVSVRVV